MRDSPGPHLLPPCTDPDSLGLHGIPFESGLEIPSLFRGKQMRMYFILETCSRTHNQWALDLWLEPPPPSVLQAKPHAPLRSLWKDWIHFIIISSLFCRNPPSVLYCYLLTPLFFWSHFQVYKVSTKSPKNVYCQSPMVERAVSFRPRGGSMELRPGAAPGSYPLRPFLHGAPSISSACVNTRGFEMIPLTLCQKNLLWALF